MIDSSWLKHYVLANKDQGHEEITIKIGFDLRILLIYHHQNFVVSTDGVISIGAEFSALFHVLEGFRDY
ncbi:hypothetical protein PV328_000676 [Microctonus aethiopoides]|uniref:Uncharacterized protein n=1 Tax=Microctonus aethiopoides TaxID=144406 RepID=A0AA39FW44_9HYME|nr:hypothetical protein PV328_000676 [Microctonus aethiopoides]